ncbi:hypothetical protein, partial [Flavonifractor plautii]|uniref:hypothetical protein n=1 Tax=Flavonifractor plautii TaxID=292800 RepID=UPI003D7C6551
EESRNTKSKRKSYTEALEKSKSTAIAVVKIEQTDILENFEKLELKDIEDYKTCKTKSLGFWGSCSVVTNPRLASDFGITAYDAD